MNEIIDQYSNLAQLIITLFGGVGTICIIIGTNVFSNKFGEGGTTSGDDEKEYEFLYMTKPMAFKIGICLSILSIVLQIFLQLLLTILERPNNTL